VVLTQRDSNKQNLLYQIYLTYCFILIIIQFKRITYMQKLDFSLKKEYAYIVIICFYYDFIY